MVTIKVQVLNVFLQAGPPYCVDDREWAVLPRGNRITNSDLIKKNCLLHVASFATYAPVLKFLVQRESVAEFTQDLLVVLAQSRRRGKPDACYRGDGSLGEYNSSKQRMVHLS